MIDTRDPKYFQRRKVWEKVSLEEWNDPVWQMKNVVTDAEGLSKVIPLTDAEKDEVARAVMHSRFQATPYYLSLIDDDNPECPIRMQIVPSIAELQPGLGDLADPLG